MQDFSATARRHIKEYRFLLLLLGITFVLYSGSVGNGFVNLDDPLLVTENPIVMHPSLQSVKLAFTSYDPELYIPATFLSYQAEAWTLGLRSWHFHLMNILLHLACVTLAYSIALKLTENRRIALLAATLLALHPLGGEAVLWISARKDLLAAFFFLASWRLWLESVNGNRAPYAMSLAAFVLALLSKVSAVTLPLVLLLSLWHLHKPVGKKELRSLAPFLALSAVFGIVALFGKTTVLGTENALTFAVMALRSTAFYLRLIAVPVGQSAVHPLLGDTPGSATLLVLLSAALILFISLLAWNQRTSRRIVMTGWLLYIVTLAPTFLHYTRGGADIILGSERYAYIPSFGIFLVAAAAAVRLYDHPAITRPTRNFLALSLVCLFLLYGYLTSGRIAIFRNSVTFNDDIINHYFAYSIAHYNLALALEADRKPQNADDEYAQSMALNPTYVNAAINRGILYMNEGRTNDALAMFRFAIAERPDYFKGYYNLAVAYMKVGRFDDAAPELEKTVELFPDFPLAHRDLATVYGKQKRFREAMDQYAILADLDPSFRTQYEAIRTGSR